MTAILFIAVLAVLVFVHELGHFSVAKKLGILVHEFAIGFPPRIFSKKVGETKYSINLVPFGGYVKIEGEDSPKEIDGEGEALINKEEIRSRSLFFRPAWQKIAVLLAGVSANIVFAWFLLSISMMSGMTSSIVPTEAEYASNVRVMVVAVNPDSPASIAKITPGTSILSFSDSEKSLNTPISSVESLQSFVQNSGGKSIFLRTSDSAGEHVLSIIPKKGIVGNDYGIGISMDFVGDLKLPVHKAFYEGVKFTWHMIVAITKGLAGLIIGIFTGSADLAQVSGPVGIAGLVGEARTLGLAYFLSFVAFISLNLAVLNLVPFPALDGGRILFVIIESIKQSPISPKVANYTNAIGFGLLMILMLVVTVRDILKLF